MNELKDYANIFDGIQPFAGPVSSGYVVDFLGMRTDANFWTTLYGVEPPNVGDGLVQTKVPTITDGEIWFEAVNWVVAAREATTHYVMITLGACYGAQAVGSYRALQAINPMPYKLVAVEPEPQNYERTARHMRDNGIDADEQWLLPFAISDRNEPIYFPVGSPGIGAHNCYSTNEPAAREFYVQHLLDAGDVESALRNLIVHNTTGMTKDLIPGRNFSAEIKLMSAITLKDVLSPFDVVDYLESDIQQSEIIVFPPFIDLLEKKVRRIHIGTHGVDVHRTLHKLFEERGWTIVFSFEPNSEFTTELGNFSTNDGVLTVRNPDL
jgi:hypothetical protein